MTGPDQKAYFEKTAYQPLGLNADGEMTDTRSEAELAREAEISFQQAEIVRYLDNPDVLARLRSVIDRVVSESYGGKLQDYMNLLVRLQPKPFQYPNGDQEDVTMVIGLQRNLNQTFHRYRKPNVDRSGTILIHENHYVEEVASESMYEHLSVGIFDEAKQAYAEVVQRISADGKYERDNFVTRDLDKLEIVSSFLRDVASALITENTSAEGGVEGD
jgi:hypothetical protein